MNFLQCHKLYSFVGRPYQAFSLHHIQIDFKVKLCRNRYNVLYISANLIF